MSELDVPYFPEDFVWGVSSAAYQMEGAVTEERFGLVHVDYPSQKRTPKESFYWYRHFIASQRRSSQ